MKRIAHAVLMTRNAPEKIRWYREMFGFLPSDEVYVGTTENVVASFNRCDRGDTFVDHHTLLCFESPNVGLNHLSFEVQSFDDLMVGHERLRAAGTATSGALADICSAARSSTTGKTRGDACTSTGPTRTC